MLRDHVDALKRCLPFAQMSEVALATVAASGEPIHLAPTMVLVREGDTADALYLVVRGNLCQLDGDRVVARYYPGNTFGERGVLGLGTDWVADAAPPSVAATSPKQTKRVAVCGETPADLIRFPGSTIKQLLCRSAASARAVNGSICVDSCPQAEIVMFTREGDSAATQEQLGSLTQAIAWAMAEDVEDLDLNDRILVVRVTPPKKHTWCQDTTKVTVGRLDIACVKVECVTHELKTWQKDYDYILFDTGDLDSEDERRLRDILRRNPKPVTTVRVGAPADLRTTAEPQGLWPACPSKPGRVLTFGVSTSLPPPSWCDRLVSPSPLCANPIPEVPREGTRLPLHLSTFSQLRSSSGECRRFARYKTLEELCGDIDTLEVSRTGASCGVSSREALSRGGRCITQRLLGVALGGGGALGFAHLPLLTAMRVAKLPVDVVAGTSFGALVAAYYCAKPKLVEYGCGRLAPEGLKLVHAQRGPLEHAISFSWISNSWARLRFMADLDHQNVEDLPIPCLPMATDIRTVSTVTFRGPVGLAVAASGAVPALFAPVTTSVGRYVDGGVLDNVPADAAVWSGGASFIVTSNPFPEPPVRSTPGPLCGGFLGRQLHELNPVHRAIDGLRAFTAMMNKIGELEGDCPERVAFKPRIPVPLVALIPYFGIWREVFDAAQETLTQDETIQQIWQGWLTRCRVPGKRRREGAAS